jgi:hypothetical protein
MIVKTEITSSKRKPSDLNEEYVHITDSQDLAEIAHHFNLDLDYEGFGSLFVQVIDGDYGLVYGTERQYNVSPDAQLFLIRMTYSEEESI